MKHINILLIFSVLSYSSFASALQLKDFNFSVDNEGITISPADRHDRYDNDRNYDHRDKGHRKHRKHDRSDNEDRNYQRNNDKSKNFSRERGQENSQQQISEKPQIKRDKHGRRYYDNTATQTPNQGIGEAWTGNAAQPAPAANDQKTPDKVVRQINKTENAAPANQVQQAPPPAPPPVVQQQAIPPAGGAAAQRQYGAGATDQGNTVPKKKSKKHKKIRP